MSYLRGPLTRNQIKILVDPIRSGLLDASAEKTKTPMQRVSAEQIPVKQQPPVISALETPPVDGQKQGGDGSIPVLPPKIKQAFLPIRGRINEGETIVYRPMVLGSAQLAFINDRINLRKNKDILMVTPVKDDILTIDWGRAEYLEVELSDISGAPVDRAIFENLPAPAGDSKNYTKWSREFVDWLYRNEVVELMQSRQFKVTSEPGESERDFRIRLQQSAREQRDEAMDKLRKKYESRISTLEERIRRAEQTVRSREDQSRQHKLQTAISVGSTILGSFLGRSPVSASTLGRATTSARGAGRVMRSQEDVKRAEETLQSHRTQLQELEEEFKRETDLLAAAMDPLTEELEQFTVKVLKKNILLKLFALAWLPYRRSPGGIAEPAW